jgi:hypothetical protein
VVTAVQIVDVVIPTDVARCCQIPCMIALSKRFWLQDSPGMSAAAHVFRSSCWPHRLGSPYGPPRRHCSTLRRVVSVHSHDKSSPVTGIVQSIYDSACLTMKPQAGPDFIMICCCTMVATTQEDPLGIMLRATKILF